MKEKETKEEIKPKQDKRDMLIAEWILKIATIENLLVSKKIITEQEIATSYFNNISKMNDFLKARLEQNDEN